MAKTTTTTLSTETAEDVFSKLSAISVKDKIERKGNLDYLSWANAWAVLKQHYPTAQRTVYEDPQTGFNYYTDGRTAWVKVGITVNGLEHIDYLPVMDFKNRAISVDNVTAMDVNKTIQRSTAKAIAMHGLGLSLWTGEDVPELTAPAPEKTEAQTLEELIKDSENWKRVVTYITHNKSQGIQAIGKQLSRKYSISADLKKEIANLING